MKVSLKDISFVVAFIFLLGVCVVGQTLLGGHGGAFPTAINGRGEIARYYLYQAPDEKGSLPPDVNDGTGLVRDNSSSVNALNPAQFVTTPAQESRWKEMGAQIQQLLKQGNSNEALPVAKEALHFAEATFGAEHLNTAAALSRLGTTYIVMGRYAEVEPLYQRALTIREKALGPDHLDVATSLYNLARLYGYQGKYSDAEAIEKRSLAIREKALGPDHPDVAASLDNLGDLYRLQGKYAESEILHKRALAIREKALGPDHLDVATSLNNLGVLYQDRGKYSVAEPLYQRALTIREKALGPDHLDVATSLSNIGVLYWYQGKYAEAESLYQRALTIREKDLGPDHPDVAMTLNNIGILYQGQGRYSEAEPLLKRSLAIYEMALGPDHPQVVVSLKNLAALYGCEGKNSEEESLQQRILAIQEKVSGPNQPQVVASQNTNDVPSLDAGPNIVKSVILNGATSLQLSPGRMYLYGMVTGGALPSSPFVVGQYAEAVNPVGNVAAALAYGVDGQDHFTTDTGYHVIGGVSVAGSWDSFNAFHSSNPQSGATFASVDFIVPGDSLVIVIALAASQQSISLQGVSGLQIDAVSSGVGTEAMTIGHAYLPRGAYSILEMSSATVEGQDPRNMADLVGVFVFGSKGQSNEAWQKMPAAQVHVVVPGDHGPWQPSLNSNYRYGVGDNAGPIVVSAADGGAWSAGAAITVAYLEGGVSPCRGCGSYDANGERDFPTNDRKIPGCGNTVAPSNYMTYPVYVVELVGTFANNGVIVGNPFAIGGGPATFTIPPDANQLLLGVNDCYLEDNTGAFTVSVSGPSPLRAQESTLSKPTYAASGPPTSGQLYNGVMAAGTTTQTIATHPGRHIPETNRPAVISEEPCIGQGDAKAKNNTHGRIQIVSGTGSFAEVTPQSKLVNVAAGAVLQGAVILRVLNQGPNFAIAPLVQTRSWGDHRTSWKQISLLHPGETTVTAQIDERAPLEMGTYHYLFAFQLELSGGNVASGTNWTRRQDVWNDGNDIAELDSSQIRQAQKFGCVVDSWLVEEGPQLFYVPADAITIEVAHSTAPSD